MQVRCAKCATTFDAAADEEPLCPVCRRFGTATGTPAPQVQEPLAPEEQANRCTIHPGNEAKDVCSRCGNFMCTLCVIRAGGKKVCPSCFDLLYRREKLFVRHATIGERLGALLLDLLVFLFIWPIADAFCSAALQDSDHEGELAIALTWLSLFVLWAFYNVTMWTFSGATLAGKVVRIKVTTPERKPPSLLRSLVRFAMFCAAPAVFILAVFEPYLFILTSVLALGHLWAAWEKKKRTWHDLIAGTEVIKFRKK